MFEMTKATAPNRMNGITNAIHPNILNKKSEIASPTKPPIPKLLISIRMLTASVTQIMISSLTKLCCVFFFVCFVLLRFLDLAAIILPPYYWQYYL